MGGNMTTKHDKYTIGRKIDKISTKIPTSSFARSSKIDPKWDIWFENIPSGNTG
jgi:hypothetical protein